jgi:hypothetical protein
MRRNGWLVFGAWALAGALTVLSFLGAASIGLFIAPLAVAAVWLALRFGRVWPEVLGTVSGAGVICLLIALLNRLEGTTACTSVEEGQVSCGGLDSTPWLVAGLVLVTAGAVAYFLARRSAHPGRRDPLVSDAQGIPTVPDRG